MTRNHRYSKETWRCLRDLSREAHEEELRRELSQLSDKFDQWKAGKLTSAELGEHVHECATRPLRKLFRKYNNDAPDHAVAVALVKGILQREQVPDDVLTVLAPTIAFAESMLSE